MPMKNMDVIVMLAWIFGIGYLLLTGDFRTYLAPYFFTLLLIALVILFFALAAKMINRGHYHYRISPMTLWLLLFPFLLMAVSSSYELGGQDLERKSPAMIVNTEVRTSDFPVDQEPALQPVIDTVTNVTSDDENDEGLYIEIKDLLLNPSYFQGKKVRFLAMFKNSQKVRKDLGEDKRVVFRYLINCCVADAQPIALIAVGITNTDIADDDWVEASGIFEMSVEGNWKVARLNDAKVRKHEEPEEPYLYIQF